MALDNAIRNVGDYYAAHYLAEKNGFQKDIADKAKAWKEQGSNSVVRRLMAQADAYYKAKTRALDFPEPELRSRSKDADINAWHSLLLNALGYQPEPGPLELESEQKQLPMLLRLNRHNQPWLVVCETPFCLTDGDNDEEALETDVQPASRQVEGLPTFISSWEKAVAMIFRQEDHPRWVMLLAGSRVYLFDAHTYAQGRYLYIDLDDAYGRRQTATFEAICALLAKDSLAPESETDEVLHERLREGSLKSTHGVSETLQGAVRQAISEIANGWVDYRRATKQGYRQLNEREPALPDGSREITPEQLRHDALIYVYRLLFCLYAEARGAELGILPINDDVYRLGYSLESLRDLVEGDEPGTTTENGTYLADHLDRLFNLIHQGFHPEGKQQEEPTENWADFGQLPKQGGLFEEPQPRQLSLKGGAAKIDRNVKTFVIQPLTATLFDPAATPLLSRVKLPNRVLYPVLRCLSLGSGEKNKRVGRINYAELGIVQLGAVYEGLLSYKGFFATEDLIQVLTDPGSNKKVLDTSIDPKIPTWFVPASRREEFKAGEIVQAEGTNKPRIYLQGSFILHLNGVDRVNSASYYTPEVLTRCLVQEALNERLKDFGPQQADQILQLSICEPAMGSAAFLVEAIDQLARAYLRQKQEQLGRSIDPSDYEDELRRVRHYIAVYNVYGVDLNPTAVELGALSLWLASIHRLKIKTGEDGNPDEYQPCATPWFGLRLRAGNSLIGARRAVWSKEQLVSGCFYGKDAEAPRQLKPGEQRQPGEIYHFLVWDEDMVPVADDALMRSYWLDESNALKEWRKQQIKQDWSPEQLSRAESICEHIDKLWQDYASERLRGLKQTECTATVWPTPANSLEATKGSTSLAMQERIKERLEAESGAFQRLKLLMDSWCSLYFWPLEQHDALPSRDAWLAAAEILCGGASLNDDATRALLEIQLGAQIDLDALIEHSQQQLPDSTELAKAVPWFGQARQIDQQQHFHHWELIFTEVLGPVTELAYSKDKNTQHQPQGFDLMFGNPPWMKVSWNDAPLLSEYEPKLGVREAKSAAYNKQRPELLKHGANRLDYRDKFTQAEGSIVFLNDRTLYPALAGVQTNLYKNFIERSWGLLGEQGIAGLLHPENVFDDPKGGNLRAHYYPRLRGHYQFKNQLMLFADIGDRNAFSINVYGAEFESVQFPAIFNLFHPSTIGKCRDVDSGQILPGIKNEKGKWDLRGHPERVILIANDELELFCNLMEDEGTPLEEARLPQVHSVQLMDVLRKFAQAPQRLSSLRGQYLATTMFDETFAQRDGMIFRQDNPAFRPSNSDEWVVSGPHFVNGTPFNKTPRSICTDKSHYDEIDLETLPDDYLPRAVYRPGDEHGNLDAFNAAIAVWPKASKPKQDDQGQWQPGFWPVREADKATWELVLGEPLKVYGIDPALPGASTAREYGFFDRWQGEVEGLIHWLKDEVHTRTSFETEYGLVQVRQAQPSEEQLKYLPRPVSSYPKYAVRAMCQPANERTLIGSLTPHGVTGINAIRFATFLDNNTLLQFASFANSVVADFFIKVKGRSNVHDDDLAQLPVLKGEVIRLAGYRTLRLSCLTRSFAHLWSELFDPNMSSDSFAVDMTGIGGQQEWTDLGAEWSQATAFRNDLIRRQAMLEVDVLVAKALGLSLDQLIQIYSVQFPVMKAYDEADEFDSQGRRLPNTTRKDPGAKELRDALKDHDGTSAVTVSWEIDNGLQTVSKTFVPPFSKVDRIEDYRRAWQHFSERFGESVVAPEQADAG